MLTQYHAIIATFIEMVYGSPSPLYSADCWRLLLQCPTCKERPLEAKMKIRGNLQKYIYLWCTKDAACRAFVWVKEGGLNPFL